jgi:hypothetical protein
MLLFLGIFTVISFTSCSNKSTQDNYVSNASLEYSPIEVPIEFDNTNVNYADIDSVPDSDGLLLAVNEALNDIEFEAVIGFDEISVKDDGIQVKADIIIKNDYEDFSISCMYLSIMSNPKWEVILINNTDNENIKSFWAYEDIRKNVDIYDYKTGDLISGKTEEFKSLDEQQKDFEEKLDSLSDEFDSNLESLKQEYNLQ